jgi:7-keto-8-aminopelargonate synthetase-like enzyme
MLKKIKDELNKLSETRGLRELHVRSARSPGSVTIKGKKLIDFTNWDSLNLNYDPRFISSFQREAEVSGVGSMAARGSSGTAPAHFAVERRIASFFGAESALLFSSANQVILSLTSALLGEGDCVIVDDNSHGRVVDAATLVNAEAINFDSSNPDSLARAIEISKPYKNKLVVTESVNPLTGATINIKNVIAVTEKAQIPWVIDESYGLGILGIRGAGALDGIETPKNLLGRFGSLSFTLGAYGAFFAGEKGVCDYLIHRSKTFITEPAMPPALAAAVEVGLGIVELDHGKRVQIKNLTGYFRNALVAAGYKTEPSSDSSIVCVKIGKKSLAQELAEGLFQKGILAEIVEIRTKLDAGAIIRFIVNSAHKEKDIDDTLAALTRIQK